jgi:curli biogenesis system outer membrane secretion channel CsgG
MIRSEWKSGTVASVILAAVSGVASTARAADAGPSIPTCDKRIGTLTVSEPENKWWGAYNLESPEALIKVFVAQSKCFTLLDRGKGLAAAQQERALASAGDVRVGSNVGKGQMKAADYVLVPDLITRNNNSGGKNIGGLLGGVIGGTVGAALGGVNIKSKTADVVLTLTDVRSTEQVSLQEGHSKKTDIGWSGGGGAFFGGLLAGGASSYANTEIGQVVTKAYLDAFTKLVADVKQIQPDAKADNVSQAVTMTKPGKLYEKADIKSTVVKDLDPGTTLYPTGDKSGPFWKVTDELGEEGWVPSALFGLAK